MKDIIKTIAESLGLTFEYARFDEANISIDGISGPILILSEIVAGTYEIKRDVMQNNVYIIDIIQSVKQEDTAENNDSIMSDIHELAMDFISDLKEEEMVEMVAAVPWVKIQENKYDLNAIGVQLTINALVDGTVRC